MILADDAEEESSCTRMVPNQSFKKTNDAEEESSCTCMVPNQSFKKTKFQCDKSIIQTLRCDLKPASV
jgi:hypothetical protein